MGLKSSFDFVQTVSPNIRTKTFWANNFIDDVKNICLCDVSTHTVCFLKPYRRLIFKGIKVTLKLKCFICQTYIESI